MCGLGGEGHVCVCVCGLGGEGHVCVVWGVRGTCVWFGG